METDYNPDGEPHSRPRTVLVTEGDRHFELGKGHTQFTVRIPCQRFCEALTSSSTRARSFSTPTQGRKVAKISSIGHFPEKMVGKNHKHNYKLWNVFDHIIDPSGMIGHWGHPVIRNKTEHTAERSLTEHLIHLRIHSACERKNIPKCLDKCFFESAEESTGRCIGLCPWTARKGDFIVILDGAHVPYLLRPVDSGYYELVGECFVERMMYGKLLNKLPKSEVLKLV